jgi:hypothetical protein
MLLCAEIGLPSILTGSPSQGKVRQQAPRQASACLSLKFYPWLVVFNPRQYSWNYTSHSSEAISQFLLCIDAYRIMMS